MNTGIKINGLWHIDNPGTPEYTLCGEAHDSDDNFVENPEYVEKAISRLSQVTCDRCNMAATKLKQIRK